MKCACVICILISILFIPRIFAQQPNDEWVVFGEKKFDCKTGTAKKYTQTITAPVLGSLLFNLQLINGNSTGGNRVTSATVKLNGVTIVTSTECNQQTASLTKEVLIKSSNTLQVTVSGPTGSYLKITCSKHLFPIHPIVECVENNGNGTYTAHFGYSNDNIYPVTVPVGLMNLFLPLPINRGQPTVFQPGRQQNVFSVVFNGKPLIWEVRGRIATATNNPSLACSGSDTTCPALSITSPLEGTITSVSSLQVSGTVSDVSPVTLTINGSAVTVDPSGAFTGTVTLTEGLNTITIVARDAANNQSTVTRTVRRDTQSPIVNFTSPVDSLMTNLQSITVSGVVSDSTVVIATLQIGNATPSQLILGSDGTFSTQITLAEGSNTISIVAVDAAANTTTISRLALRDSQSPVITISLPLDSSFTNSSTAAISGTVTESNLASLTVAGSLVTVNPDGSYSTQVDLNEGLNTISIVATDRAGNSATVTGFAIRDTQSPIVNLTSPIDSLITNLPTITIIGTVTDEHFALLKINDNPVTVDSAGAYFLQLNLNEGTNTISIVAVDKAGNSTMVTRFVIRDTQLPIVDLQLPVDSAITNQQTVTVSGMVTDSTAVTLIINGSSVPVGVDGVFNHQLSVTEGLNTITVIATDAAGNTNTDSILVIRDSQSPILTILSPLDSIITKLQSIIINGTVTDEHFASLKINDNPIAVDSAGAYSVQLNLNEGTNTISIVATDKAGNSTAKSRLVIRDTQSPVVNLTSPIDSAVTNKTKIVISGSITDSSSVIFTINGLAFPLNDNKSFSDTLLINEGKNYFNIVASDTVGNQTTIKRTVIRDTQPPAILIASPVPNAITTDSLISVIGSIIDSTRITATVNGVAKSVGLEGGFASSLVLSDGNNTISVVAIDQAGNTSTITRNVSKVIPPPDPIAVAPHVDTTIATTVMDATEFLYTGTNPVQKEVAPGTINKIQVTALRGRVLDKEMQPLSGAKVTILGKSELGYTFSREDGMYDIAVNGGSDVNVNFEKVGYLPAQRQVTTSWATYSSVDDVVLMQLDTTAHRVDFTQPEVVQGTQATDSLGTRRPSLFFNQGTQAKLVFNAYNYKYIGGCSYTYQGKQYSEPTKIIPIPIDSLAVAKSINVRATEYTVGSNGEAAIPAKLPETVAYTFVVELTSDEMLSTGAKDVRFNQPVSLYLENVMNFPVGLTVPMGCYNRERGFWETSDNGHVIKILSTSDSIAAIDYNGDGVAELSDTLVAKGISISEQQYLASTYSAGQSLWRAEITHLGTYAGGFGMIATNAVYPQNPLPDRYAKVDRDNIVAGSVIGVQNQTLGESLPITNTPMTMNYKSDRVFGRREAYCLDIPLTGNTIPQGMSKVTLEIEIVGNTYNFEFAPQANLTHHFEWDGKDAYGRRVQGQQNVLTTISYCYPAQYSLPPDVKKCFATPSGQIMEQYIAARKETRRTQIWEGKIGAFDILSLGIGGWSLNLHHGYDCVGRILYKGTGEVRSANVMDNVINTIAGKPDGSVSQKCLPSEWIDGRIAAQTKIAPAYTLQFTADGTLIYGDALGNINKIDSAGIITTIAGKLGGCFSGMPDTTTGIAANCANLAFSLAGGSRIVQGSDKGLYVSDASKNVIWRITPDGEITRFAGVHYDNPYGNQGRFGGDGGLALNAYFNSPGPIAFGKDGCLYVGELANYRIRKITPDGIITTIAGTGVQGYSGDGGPATKAAISEPRGLTVAPDGSILFSDYRNFRIRRITPDGIIRTFAGNGSDIGMNTGDGGPALQARIRYSSDITVGKDGTVFFNSSEKIRGVATDNYIKTIIGGGNTFWVDNGPATSTALGSESKIIYGPDGNLYVGDWPWLLNAPSSVNGPRIFKVAPPLPGITLSEILIASEDGSERYVFTYSGRHLRTLDALTGVVKYSFGYDSNYKLITITDVDSLITHIERDPSGKVTAIISPYGVRNQINLDSLGYLLQAVNPASESRQFTYTDGGLMTSMTDARSNTYHYEYDSLGYLTRDLDPVGGYTNLTRTYDTLGYTVTSVTAMGKKTIYRSEKSPDGTRRFISIDPNGLKTITVDSTDGSTYTITPEGMNRPATEKPDPRFGMQSPLVNATAKTPGGLQSNVNQFRTVTQMTGTAVTGLQDSISVNGKAFKTNYDGNARILTKTSAEGRKTFSFFDAKGRIMKDSIPGILATKYKYDNKGRKIEDNQGGRKTTYAYDSLGRQAKVTDPYGRSTQFFYDGGDRLLKTILPDLSEVSFTYDKNGNMLSLTPPGKPDHTFDYSKVDLETLYTPPFADDSARTTAKTYTLDKEPWKVLRPDSLNITLEYGGKGSLAGYPKKIFFDRGNLINLFDTTKAQLIGVVTPNGDTLRFIYDGAILKKTTWTGPNGFNTVKGSISFAYNSELQVSTETVLPATGLVDSVNLRYDKDGVLTSIGLMKLRYASNNNLLLSDTVGDIITNYTYDSFGSLSSKETKIDVTVLNKLDYAYDSLSRITEKREKIQGITTKYNYVYDYSGRLWTVLRNDTLMSEYTYDANGNRLSQWMSAKINSSLYDTQDRLLKYSSMRYFYTKNGDIKMKIDTVTSDTTRYSYDALGSLRSVQLRDGTLIDYLIDGSGRRVGRKVDGLVTQKWLYSSDLRIVAELDSTNHVTSRFIYTSSANVPEYMVKNGINYRFVTDHLGSVRQIVDVQTGAIVQQIDYDEYGNILTDTNPGFTPFGYAGGLYDMQTKLVRFGVRDYDATIGRWVIKDPIGFGGKDGNFYGYVGQDPINFNDPHGLWKSEQHRALTQEAMPIKGETSEEARRNDGFTAQEVKWAEDANTFQDSPFSSGFYYDSRQGTGNMSAVLLVANTYLTQAISFDMIDAITGEGQKTAMKYLGAGLHTLQDVSAHQGYGSGIGIWIKHVTESPNPDDSNARPNEYEVARVVSKSYIQYFLNKGQ